MCLPVIIIQCKPHTKKKVGGQMDGWMLCPRKSNRDIDRRQVSVDEQNMTVTEASIILPRKHDTTLWTDTAHETPDSPRASVCR